MISAYFKDKNDIQTVTEQNLDTISEAVWIDLLNPTKEEELQVEKILNLDIPTREDMREIEFSSRLYQEDQNLFMTVLMIAHSDTAHPILDPVTMILTAKQLITVRYQTPQTFNLFSARIKKINIDHRSAIRFLVELLDASVDRLADILESVGLHIDESSRKIFHTHITENQHGKRNYRRILQNIGTHGDLNTKARESLITFNRLVIFLGQLEQDKLNHHLQTRLITLRKDIESLSNHADFISNKVNFLLEATLGMVNIDQNNTIRIVSVVTLVFLPPTLIASIYGMNFKFMPELSWVWGYPLSLIIMVLAAWLPYKYFKRRRWL